MSDTDLGRNNPNAEQEPGFLHIEEKEDKQPEVEAHPAGAESSAAPRVVERSSVNTGTVEHLAARKAMPALDTSTPAFKQRMAELRAALTRLVTGIRWDNLSVDEAANQVIPLLNVGPVQQWKAEMIPFLFEIDRAGNFVPVWLHIIERGDPPDLPADANPAETATGRARRFAILMLGRYKHGWAVEKQKSLGFSRQGVREDKTESLPKILARLAIDPNTSLYATQALVQMGTNSALQALLEAHKQAEGWAKIDVMEALLALNLEQFHEILLASALERVPGLESYAAIPLYRSIPLEKYLHTEGSASSYTARQAALVLGQVLQNSLSSASKAGSSKPIAFERDLSLTLTALLDELHAHATWEHTLALHYSGRLMGYYWGAISKGAIKEPEIVDPVYSCLPMMHEVERWINGSGRDTLLEALSEGGEDINLTPLVKVLGELRDSRANGPLTARLDEVRMLTDRTQALMLDAMCTTLGQLGDRRALESMQQMLYRTVDTNRRKSHAKRREPLTAEDADVPGSIVYAAFLRACGMLGDRSRLESVLAGLQDFDPYVRGQALEALKRLDPGGEDTRSRQAISSALNDPRDAIVRSALQGVVQYRYHDALPEVRQIHETRPPLAAAAFDTLRQLGQA